MKTKTTQCPSCQHKVNAVTPVSGKGKPAPGDITVCTRCGALMCFSRSLRVRLLTEPELRKLPQKQLILLRKMQRTIEKLRAERAGRHED